MEFKDPRVVYTAATNMEAILIAKMLNSNGVPAYAVEDQSGVSLWAFGTITQYHRPNVWVDLSTAEEARQLLLRYEEEQRQRQHAEISAGAIEAECEDCGEKSQFPAALNGTTQECPHCRAYLDVGVFDWDEDVGEPDDS